MIDGHNRYEIIKKHDLPFNTITMNFDSRDDALIWIISTQVSRRNLSPLQLSHFRGLHYNTDKRIVTNLSGRNQFSEVDVQVEHQPPSQSTASRLAEQYNVSPMTIRRDAQVSNAINAIGEVSPEAKRKILSGEANISRRRLQELSSGSEEEIVETAGKIKDGTHERRISTGQGADAASGRAVSAFDSDFSSGFGSNIDDILTFEALIRKVTDNINAGQRSDSGNDKSAELKTALRSFIDTLENLYSLM